MEIFEERLNELKEANRSSLNDWFYNADDSQLISAINLMTSYKVYTTYPHKHLSEYIKFARKLLKGEIPAPPSDLDLTKPCEADPYKIAKGCYSIVETARKLIKRKLKFFFILTKIIILKSYEFYTDSRGITMCPTKSKSKITRHIASFSRILYSRLQVSLKIALNSLKNFINPQQAGFLVKFQRKKIMMKCVKEMIKKGRVNLEQRAYWKWKIVTAEFFDPHSCETSINDDLFLLKLLCHNANLRYFHELKVFFDVWKQALSAQSSRKSSCSLVATEKTSEDVLNISSPHIRNLVHIVKTQLRRYFDKWRVKKVEYEYQEYEEYEEYQNFVTEKYCEEKFVFVAAVKPVILIEKCYNPIRKHAKILLRNANYIFVRKLRLIWVEWLKAKKNEINFSTEISIDLSMFRLQAMKAEKLKVITRRFIEIFDIRQNFSTVCLSKWTQAAYAKTLTASENKLKNQSFLNSD